jgi:hypothetical protein
VPPRLNRIAGAEKVGNPFDGFEAFEDKPELSAEQLGSPPLLAGFQLDQPAQPAKPVPYMRVTTSCVTWSWLGFVLLFAFGPPTFLLLVAAAYHWVWRGFCAR